MFSSQMMQYVQNQEIHNIYVEYVFGSSINVHMVRNYLRKVFFFLCFHNIFISNATFNSLYDNFRILYAKEHQKRGGYACMYFHMRKIKHL